MQNMQKRMQTDILLKNCVHKILDAIIRESCKNFRRDNSCEIYHMYPYMSSNLTV